MSILYIISDYFRHRRRIRRSLSGLSARSWKATNGCKERWGRY